MFMITQSGAENLAAALLIALIIGAVLFYPLGGGFDRGEKAVKRISAAFWLIAAISVVIALLSELAT